jgi:hypothetical protein
MKKIRFSRFDWSALPMVLTVCLCLAALGTLAVMAFLGK